MPSPYFYPFLVCVFCSYCSVEHQRLHWPSHKPLCISHSHSDSLQQNQSTNQGVSQNGTAATKSINSNRNDIHNNPSPQPHPQSHQPMILTPEALLKSHALCVHTSFHRSPASATSSSSSSSSASSSSSSSSSSASSSSSSSSFVVVEGVVTAAVALLRAYLDRGQGLGPGLAPGQGLDAHTPATGHQAFDSAVTTMSTSSTTTVQNGGTPEQLALVFSVCLAIEAIAHCALVQGKERFRPRLAECLFPLVALAATSTVDAPPESFSAQEQGPGLGSGSASGPGLGLVVVHPSVQLAARTTLARLAGYLHYHPSQAMPIHLPPATTSATTPSSSSSSSSSSSLSLSLTAALLRDNMDYLTGSPII